MVAPATSASLGAMGLLLEKLEVLLGDSGHPLWLLKRAKSGVQHLKVDLEEISTYLELLSEVVDPPLTAKCWMKEARELSYDIEDYIDRFARYGRGANSIKTRFVFLRSKTGISKIAGLPRKLKRRKGGAADTILEFRIRAEAAIERFERYYRLHCRSSSRTYALVPGRRMLNPAAPPQHEGFDLVIDDRVIEFIESLANDADEHRKVVSIVGSGGIGKTTLAGVLYNKLKGQFDCRAFVGMTRNPDVKTLLRHILRQVQRRHTYDEGQDLDLTGEISKYLQDKRYLIVIDDLWATSVWDIISYAFPEGSQGSKIITTTEMEDIALSCCCYQSDYVFQMKPLPRDHSRKLFFNQFCCSESEFSQDFKKISYEIVEICGGSPLATSSIASLLASHPEKSMKHWTHIRDSLSSILRTSSTSEGIRLVLNLSYNNLSPHLKTCLLYLNVYPEGSTVCKHDLVKQWMAEGFIDGAEGQDVEKVAESYFYELIDRRFLRPIKFKGGVVSCTVDDVVRDLIALNSAEENFIVAVDSYRKNVKLCDKVRRLSLQFNDARHAKTPGNIRASQVRSLAFFGLFKCMPFITNFKIVRVLNLQLSGKHGDKTLDLIGISELFQLRYLKVAGDGCIKLPRHMRRLQYLETVHIDVEVIAVPLDIIHLPSLLHLHLPFQTNLTDVWIRSVDSGGMRSIGNLTNLRDLGLNCSTLHHDHLEKNMEALGSLLDGFGSLRTLSLVPGSSYKNDVVYTPSEVVISWDSFTPPLFLQRFEWLPYSCPFFRVPMWIKELGNLRFLKIATRELMMNGVEILRGLPVLTALSLYVRTAPVERITFDKVGFPVLKHFKFSCSTVPCLKFEADGMQNLRKLKLGFNAHIVHQHASTPISIEHLPGLREISLKIGGTGTDAESHLTALISSHPNNPRIEIQLVDRAFHFSRVMSILSKEKEQETPKEDPIVGEDLDEYYVTTNEDSWEEQDEQARNMKTHDQMHIIMPEEQDEFLEEESKGYDVTEDEHSVEAEHEEYDVSSKQQHRIEGSGSRGGKPRSVRPSPEQIPGEPARGCGRERRAEPVRARAGLIRAPLHRSMGGEAPEPRRLTRALSIGGGDGWWIADMLHLVMGFLEDPRDREAASLVCRRWHRIDAASRKHVTVRFCYAVSPARLLARFPRLESLAVKGKPRAAMYGLFPDDWGANARPWITELAAPLECLKALRLRRMVVTDDDLAELVRARGHMLQELKLDKCTGFSTDGLRLVARSCRSLRTLFLEECQVTDKGSQWIRDLAVNCPVLATLNFHMTELEVMPADLDLLAKNCKSLISLKISDCKLSDLIDFFRAATALEEFAGGTFNEQGKLTNYGNVKFPSRLYSLGLTFMGTNEMPIIFPFSAVLKKLDLEYTFLTTEDHCQLISKCPNLLVLTVRNVIGDIGLGVVADTCKKLQRLRIERGDDVQEQGGVSQVGLTAIAVGCRDLEYIATYVSDITNGALESIGTFCKKLYDFRLVLLDREEGITDLPLDNGVRALLKGCTKLRRFALYLRPGGLSDVGLGYIGQCSGNIQYMLLGNVGETDNGLFSFAFGCVNLRKLELRNCCFSERALALAILQMPSLRYVWIQGYKASQTGRDLMLMARQYWNIEFTPPNPENANRLTEDGEPCVDGQAQILAYYSLAGKRLDCPQSVVPLYPA